MLRSTFSGFTMAQSALMASQRAIDVAGQNLSNINTEGYTRQRLDVASITPIGSSKAITRLDNNVGQGVEMTGISQIRDPYIDAQFRTQLAKIGTADATDAILEDIGMIFDETDSTAIRAALNDVITQLNTMSSTANAAEDSLDEIIRSSFSILLNTIHQNASELQQVEENVVIQLEDAIIPDINEILKSIADMNETIKNAQVLGMPALELMDERNLLIDELAKYLPINANYTQDPNPTVNADELSITFTDANGNVHNLVDDNLYGSVEMTGTEVPYTLTLTDADPAVTTTTDITDLIPNGVLKGNFDMLNKAGDFDGSDIKGIGYYEQMFDMFVSEFATGLNELNADRDAAGNIIPNTNVLFEAIDDTQPLSATNIKISDGWASGTTELKKTHQVGADGGELSTAYDNILAMSNFLSSDKHAFTHTYGTTTVTIFSGTIQGLYDNIQNVQAVERKASSSILNTGVMVLSQIADSRDAVSGVSQDEEVMDLMKYQQSYNAASRMVTVLDEMLDKLINGTGVVGR